MRAEWCSGNPFKKTKSQKYRENFNCKILRVKFGLKVFKSTYNFQVRLKDIILCRKNFV